MKKTFYLSKGTKTQPQDIFIFTVPEKRFEPVMVTHIYRQRNEQGQITSQKTTCRPYQRDAARSMWRDLVDEDFVQSTTIH